MEKLKNAVHEITIQIVTSQGVDHDVVRRRIICSCGFEDSFPSQMNDWRSAIVNHKLDVLAARAKTKFSETELEPRVEEE